MLNMIYPTCIWSLVTVGYRISDFFEKSLNARIIKMHSIVVDFQNVISIFSIKVKLNYLCMYISRVADLKLKAFDGHLISFLTA